jgi:hypothetical protein
MIDEASPMSRYFDGDCLSPTSQKPRRPPRFFGPPFGLNEPSAPATELSETIKQQHASFASYEPSEISCAASAEINDTDRWKPPETNTGTRSASIASGQIVEQKEMEEESVPVVNNKPRRKSAPAAYGMFTSCSDGHSDRESSNKSALAAYGMFASCSDGHCDPESSNKSKITKITDNSGGVYTVMIKNIPCSCKREDILQAVAELGFADQHDFFYVPMRHGKIPGYAFIGFPSTDLTRKFTIAMTGYRFSSKESKKSVIVVPASIQGLSKNVEYFKDSSVMQTDAKPFFMHRQTPSRKLESSSQ